MRNIWIALALSGCGSGSEPVEVSGNAPVPTPAPAASTVVPAPVPVPVPTVIYVPVPVANPPVAATPSQPEVLLPPVHPPETPSVAPPGPVDGISTPPSPPAASPAAPILPTSTALVCTGGFFINNEFMPFTANLTVAYDLSQFPQISVTAPYPLNSGTTTMSPVGDGYEFTLGTMPAWETSQYFMRDSKIVYVMKPIRRSNQVPYTCRPQ